MTLTSVWDGLTPDRSRADAVEVPSPRDFFSLRDEIQKAQDHTLGVVAFGDAIDISGGATTLFTVPLASGSTKGGQFNLLIKITDGVDFQNMSALVRWSAANKANSLTFSSDATIEPKALTGGSTLTIAITGTLSSGVLSVKVTPTTSLTPTSATAQVNQNVYA